MDNIKIWVLLRIYYLMQLIEKQMQAAAAVVQQQLMEGPLPHNSSN